MFCLFSLCLAEAGVISESAAGFSGFLVHEESLFKVYEFDK